MLSGVEPDVSVFAGRRGAPALLALGDLQILRGLARGKTQAEIGEELHLEQSTISKMLKACELRTGLVLVAHSGRRLELSPAGCELAAAAERALAAFDRLDRLALDLRAGLTGTVRVIASSTPGSYVLPGLLADFLRERPGVSIDLQITPVSSIWDAFESERYDFAVAPALGLPRELRSEPLYDDPVVFFAEPGSPAAAKADLTLSDLRDETLIGKFVDSHWRSIFREFERRGFRAARKFTIIPPEGVKRMVAEGLGIGVLFESSLRAELDRGLLVRLPIADPSLRQTFCLAFAPAEVLSPAAEAFVAYLRGRLSYAATAYVAGELEL